MRREPKWVLFGFPAVMVAVAIAVNLPHWWTPRLPPSAQAQVIPGPAAQVAASAMGASTVSGGNWQMTGITDSLAVAVTVPAGTGRIEIQAEDANLRWRSDGTSPTSSVGSVIYAGDSRMFTASLAAIELIATSDTAKANLHGANR